MRLLTVLLCLTTLAGCAREPKALRVCADPNNLPFSNRAGEGFENKLVELAAKELGRKVEYTWWAQRRGYVRNTLKDDRCDVWPGVATQVEMLATTRPYYRSSYVFLSRADRSLDIRSFDDPRLKTLTVGVQMIGDDAANTPPAHALARRGIIGNVRGYMLYGDYSQPNPPAAIVQAVDRGDIDVAVVWGPLAGYFASKAAHPMRLEPVTPWLDGPQWPMMFDVSMGVRREDAELREALDRVLERRAGEISRLLQAYHVPVMQDPVGR
ncbi:substrate-binding domain-containing protein [Phenylobacterium deserti]|uniref:Quinoprotein dehydrogenase-associated putative ABC transporter substrate-binding protein n=1 Tax=Phenylobacterium deserti TaxID=1914756 RepID=A0A328A8J7_9CAUL|nr:substrate-binding domain-containing protein [Phenylobacterium deserti]RAK50789.1 quinoprotein dehydrogenase-associated putative ABC transporter substrate-binding protein [Phenylobacterium deserti]